MLELKCDQTFKMGSTYDYTKQIESTLLESIPSRIKSKCTIRKIIRSVCSLTKINPLETCLLSWLLTRSKYDIEKISIESRTNIVEEQYDHKVLIFLLLNCYYVKSFICETISNDINDEILTHVPNFKMLYDKFNPEKSLKTLSLCDVNKIFEDWTCRKNKANQTDYNNLVDKILYLSKTYNVSGPDDRDDSLMNNKLGLPQKRKKGRNNKNSVSANDEPNKSERSNKINRFSNSQQPQQDLMGPSQDNADYVYRRETMEMNPLRRSTRNMLQSINIYDIIPSQDNLFNSQISAGLFSSNIQNPVLFSQNQSLSNNRRANNSSNKMQPSMKLKQTQSYDSIK